ncbi:hypothetical protein EJB05_20147 [Eragrostis curvula]|uniref:Fucosyltransferase n=1 Tax=Eragrostis curvula TaxID=38414 RepID=A0A5J9UXZ8_9POAL|nr:hypothetical protein EJB05_20147 [Eragrostis curvula]
MDMKRARSPRAPVDAEEDKRRPGWRSSGVRPELVLVGFLLTLPLLVFVFGGRWGSSSFPSSSAGSNPVDRHDVATDAGSATPQSTSVSGQASGRIALCRIRRVLLPEPLQIQPLPEAIPFPALPLPGAEAEEVRGVPQEVRPRDEAVPPGHQASQGRAQRRRRRVQVRGVVPLQRLGNRMLTIASTFLYALLTDRVLLMHVAPEQEGLFCEPFPGSSWVLPGDFPHNNPFALNIGAPESYANMLKNGVVRNDDPNVPASSLPPYVYLHIEQFRLKLSDNVFCDEDQVLLSKFNWMILKSDSYFAPALFLTPMFEKELARMFPKKESVFHHLGRYLFHPTNRVWGIISRYYEAYLARVDEKIGFQIRIFPEKPIKFENMYDQLVRCIREQKLLPELGTAEPTNSTAADAGKVKAVLIASLYSGYYEKIRGMYYENPTKTGEIVAVYQPSHEEEQQYTSNEHNQKALAEIYLLSYCDKITMSAWSTFGYVAYSFAGVKPWILLRPDWNKEVSEVACVRSTSVEPCLHSPPILGCRARKEVDAAAVKPYVRHCEDVGFGVKLFDN